jgi:ribonucleoside-diphosphate reductase alpha chain
MKRVQNDEDWYLFDPLEVADLNELYGAAFSKRYAEYIAMAEKGEMNLFKKISAREQFKQILISLQSSSHPWLTWKDTINLRALNNNTGTIHSSNLCTEICLPQDAENVSVCNLASINLSTHLVDGKWDWNMMDESARIAVRQLDNLIDITRSSVNEADKANKENRAVGLGIMGFADVCERLGISYESEEAYDLIDEITERISYSAIDESANLARERGSYDNFDGSRWSQGLVPFDSIDLAEKDRGVAIEISRKTRLDWDALRVKVKGGIRVVALPVRNQMLQRVFVQQIGRGADIPITFVRFRTYGANRFGKAHIVFGIDIVGVRLMLHHIGGRDLIRYVFLVLVGNANTFKRFVLMYLVRARHSYLFSFID